MIRELQVGEELYFTKAKGAIVFHIPGHCAGCKRAIATLEQSASENWDIILIDAESDKFKSYVEKYGAKTAPTIITFNKGTADKTFTGLKEFLANKSIFEE